MRGGQNYWESSKIGGDFACSTTTRGSRDKWKWQADSARQTGLESTIQEVLTIVESGDAGGQKWSEIGEDFACIATTRRTTDKCRSQADSARQTGLDPAFQEVLSVVESGDAGGTKIVGIRQNRRRLCL